MRSPLIAADVIIPPDTTMANDVTIGAGVLLSDKLTIEAGAIIERGVIFANTGSKPSQVRSQVRIGTGAVIGPDVELGWGAHIKPGSVVLTSVPANAVVQGNPAQIVGYTEGFSTVKSGSSTTVATESLGKDRHEVLATPIGIGDAALYHMPRVLDLRGSLSVGELEADFPFNPKRYFIVFDVPSEELRGEHAHRACHQFLICVKGSCRALLDDGITRKEVVLDQPNIGLYMPPMIWGTQYRYTHDAVLLVLASHAYDATDYIRAYDDFQSEVARRKK